MVHLFGNSGHTPAAFEHLRVEIADPSEYDCGIREQFVPIAHLHVQGRIVEADNQVDLAVPVLVRKEILHTGNVFRFRMTLGIQVFDGEIDVRIGFAEPFEQARYLGIGPGESGMV